jgi:biotin transport system substrate-specific component
VRRPNERPWKRLIGVAVAVSATALAARWSFELPLTPVPQTAQTLAVLITGVALGPRWGALAMALYVLLGAIGLPVFAGGESGFAHLVGPTGGFLLGFLLGAALAGWWVEAGGARTFPGAAAGMLLAHAAILLTGWAWLAVSLGASDAWLKGVAPFVGGAVVKSLLAGFVAHLRGRRIAPAPIDPTAGGV